jgi:hypothetical protein
VSIHSVQYSSLQYQWMLVHCTHCFKTRAFFSIFLGLPLLAVVTHSYYLILVRSVALCYFGTDTIGPLSLDRRSTNLLRPLRHSYSKARLISKRCKIREMSRVIPVSLHMRSWSQKPRALSCPSLFENERRRRKNALPINPHLRRRSPVSARWPEEPHVTQDIVCTTQYSGRA